MSPSSIPSESSEPSFSPSISSVPSVAPSTLHPTISLAPSDKPSSPQGTLYDGEECQFNNECVSGTCTSDKVCEAKVRILAYINLIKDFVKLFNSPLFLYKEFCNRQRW